MKKILFITGTRADYGKLKSIINKLSKSKKFEILVYVTGMHLLKKYGNTYLELEKDGIKNYYLSKPIKNSNTMDEVLAYNILQMSKYIKNKNPDMIFVHGDRVEALAGAIVGSMNNIYVSHIEGGEVTGTIDNSIRHAISKLAHFHFVSNDQAKQRLLQMGEEEKNIFVVGSPDIDIMIKNNFDINEIKRIYEIPFENYGILIYHPVTTELEDIQNYIKTLVDVVIESNKQYVVICPNNDPGSELIFKEYKRLQNNENFKIFPSIRFEYFLTILKNADFVIGNSSLGIRESGVYGIPTINIGSRQNGRFNLEIQKNLCNVEHDHDKILEKINNINLYKYKVSLFGDGNSDDLIFKILKDDKLWKTKIQKKFVSIF